MSNLQTNYHLKLYFQKVDHHTGLIHGTKRRRENQMICVIWTLYKSLLSMYGWNILYIFSKVPIEISFKISNWYIERCVFYLQVKI